MPKIQWHILTKSKKCAIIILSFVAVFKPPKTYTFLSKLNTVSVAIKGAERHITSVSTLLC